MARESQTYKSTMNPDMQARIVANRNLLAVSNINFETVNFPHVGDHMSDLFAGRRDVLIFTHRVGNTEAAARRAEAALRYHGVVSTRRVDDLTREELAEIAKDAQGAFITGGNTFDGSGKMFRNRLAGRNEMDDADVVRTITANGAGVGGWSAGAMLQAERIGPCEDELVFEKTDAGIVVPAQGLDMIARDLSIFPHHKDSKDALVASTATANPGLRILALRDGAAVRIQGTSRMEVVGETSASLYIAGQDVRVINPGTDIRKFF